MNHYIFIATGNDTEQNGKERTEYRHEVLTDNGEAYLSADRLCTSLVAAGWANVAVEVRKIKEMEPIMAIVRMEL